MESCIFVLSVNWLLFFDDISTVSIFETQNLQKNELRKSNGITSIASMFKYVRIFYKYFFKNFMNTKDQILYYILLLLYESYKMIFFIRFKFIYRYITNLILLLVKRILRAGVSQVATTTFYLSLFGNFLGLLVNKAIWRIIFFKKIYADKRKIFFLWYEMLKILSWETYYILS